MKRITILLSALLVTSMLIAQNSSTSIAKAKAIMGSKNFFGPQEINKALNIKIDTTTVTPVPFSEKELERAKSLGLILILRLPLSIESLNKVLGGKLPGNSQLLQNYDVKEGRMQKKTWYINEDWFTKAEGNKPYWALSSNKFIAASSNKTYLQQSNQLANYLKTKVFAGLDTLPEPYRSAICELDSLRPIIENIGNGKEDKKRREVLMQSLKINQLCRPSPVNVVYDLAIMFNTNKTRSFVNTTIMTNVVGIFIGYFDETGLIIDRVLPDDNEEEMGCTFNQKSQKR